MFKRLDIAPEYFHNSYARDLFGLSKDQFDNVLAKGGSDLAVRLLHVDVWADVCLNGGSEDDSIAKLRQMVKIRPEKAAA